MKKTSILSRMCALFSTVAIMNCSAAAPENTSPAQGMASTTPNHKVSIYGSTIVQPNIPGYQHTIEASKIHLGANVHNEQLGNLASWVGDDGTFSVDNTSGLVIAANSSVSPAYLAPSYSGGFEAHKALVKSYFLSAGLPADQVRGVAGFSKGTTSGFAAGASPGQPILLGFASTVARIVSSYPVPESSAAAQFNANGEVVREVVYWPELPGSVLSDATALSAVVADAVQGPTYLASLPLIGQPVVVIHHSVDNPAGLVAFASCDVVNTGLATRHFDINGAELMLPEEARAAMTATSRITQQ